MRHCLRNSIAGLLVSLFLPATVFAACSDQGYTIVFINGIFNTKEQAQDSKNALEKIFGPTFKEEKVNFRIGYNPSHLAGLGDLVQVVSQSFGTTISTYDRDAILMQLHPEVTTQKIFLIGHSQGTLYTNSLYDYLVKEGGAPTGVLGVYNVATPANYVAGGGTYLTSAADAVIDLYAHYAKKAGALAPLSPNAQLDPGAAVGNGHDFTRIYLTYAGERMVGEIQRGLSLLRAQKGAAEEGCFTPPGAGLVHNTKKAFYAVADPTALGIKTAAVVGGKGVAYAYEGAQNGLAAAGSLFGSLTKAIVPKPRTANLPGSHSVVDALYGSSVNEQDLRDLLGTSQSGAVALASSKKKIVEEETVFEEDNGEIKGVEVEKLAEPLIPPPVGVSGGLVSPGFGGGGETSVATEDTASASSAPAAAKVPDGISPTLISVTADGSTLLPVYASIFSAPLATSGAVWKVRIEFSEEIAVPPSVEDSPLNSSPKTSHAIDDCGDADRKTFCFTYHATPGQQANTLSRLDQWAFEISDAMDDSGEVMVNTTYTFAIETKTPTITPGHVNMNSQLPSIAGKVSEHRTEIQVLVDGHFFTTAVGDPFIFIPGTFDWSVTLSPGQELAEGYHDVQASSTDAVGNAGPVSTWQILVDLAPPIVSLIPDIAEGADLMSTVGHIQVQSSDNHAGVSHTCDIDGFFSTNCSGLDVAGLAAGAHVLKVVATDIAGNQTTLVRNFSVLP